MPLTDTFVRNVKPTGTQAKKYTDGNGMYLLVNESGKYWRLNYRYLGKRKTLALGVYPDVSLSKARTRCAEAQAQLADGVVPNLAKRQQKLAVAAAARQTFETVARSWLHKTEALRAASTQDKVTGWLQRSVFPYIGEVPIAALTSRDILACLQRIEARGALDSAHRVKQICGQVFRFAVAAGLADRDMTADLKGAISVPKKRNYAAITEPRQVAGLMRSIYGYRGLPYAVAALKLSALFFVRPGELRSAEWGEIDFDNAEWRIPGSKMKMKSDHIVPLSRQAREILQSLHPMTGHGRFVFRSVRTDERCMSENTVAAALRSMGYPKVTMSAHGFPAMARTIVDEVLGERVDLIEHQLAHTVIDPNGWAYNRTAHLPARRQMMQRWANYLDELRVG